MGTDGLMAGSMSIHTDGLVVFDPFPEGPAGLPDDCESWEGSERVLEGF